MAAFIVRGIKWTAEKLSSLLPSATPASSSSAPSEASNTVLEDLKRLERTMKRIQTILMDAHERDIRDHSEKLRLKELKELAYDAEDVVGDYAYDVLHAKIQYRNRVLGLDAGGSTGQKRKRPAEVIDLDAISISVPVSNEISGRVKEIRARFEEITGEWETLQLRESDAPRQMNYDTWARPPTSSLVRESDVHGRDGDKERIIKQLLFEDGGSKNGTLRVLSIVGMGGIGKTTLAQLIYNDARIGKHFNLKGWVCVPEKFCVPSLTRDIIESFTQRPCYPSQLNKLQLQLTKIVRAKSFILVLDDVWNENESMWNSLCDPLKSAASGTVIITARSNTVVNIMQTHPPYILDNLKFDDCWSLFKQIVFNREDRDVDEHRINIAQQIVARCCGLPLAVKAIGGTLRYDYDIKNWIDILESNELGSNTGNGNFLPILKLSYDYMPLYLKECFASFALFPKNYDILEDSIIKLWISMGLVPLVHSDSGKKLEDIGRVYLNEFQDRFMIQLKSGSSDKQRVFVIHDLLLVLAQQVAGCEFWRRDFHAQIQSPGHLSSTVRYLYYRRPDNIVNLHHFQGSINLRAVLVLDSYCREEICSWLEHLRYLRALDLSHLMMLDKLPESIGNLKQLRYLNLYGTPLHFLPDSICSLYNLEFLELTESHIVKLPKAFGQLKSLQYLSYSPRYLSYLPCGIGLLTNLRTLSAFIVGNDDSKCNIGELEYLACLSGTLPIMRLGNVTSMEKVRPSLLRNKSLQELTLDWTSDNSVQVRRLDGTSLMSDFHERLLRTLEPHPCLVKLTISMYCGPKFPQWLGNLNFNKLVRISLRFFLCEFLPPLGQLPSLKLLTCVGGNNVRQVGHEFHGYHATMQGFQSLECLEFSEMTKWERWSGVKDGDFPKLHSLVICNCPKLVALPSGLSSKLRTIKIVYSEQLSRISTIPSLEYLYLAGQINEKLLVHSHFPQLKTLELSCVDNIVHLDVNQRRFPVLEMLTIRGCKDLQSVVALTSLVSLKQLRIIKCPQLSIYQEDFHLHLNREISLCDDIFYMTKHEGFTSC